MLSASIANRRKFVAQIKLCQLKIVVQIETELGTENVPNEAGRLCELLVKNKFLVELDLVLHDE